MLYDIFFFNETTDIIVVLQCLIVFSVTKFCVNVKMCISTEVKILLRTISKLSSCQSGRDQLQCLLRGMYC